VTDRDLTIAQAARQLGVEERRVRGWIRDGLLPARRLPGGRARLPAVPVWALLDQTLPAPSGQINRRDDHACFGCGRLNPFGLQLHFVADEAGVWADFVPGRLREGWTGTVHGGILATLLDEVLAWALFHHRIVAVTARLAITYRRPAPVGEPLRAHGRIVRDRGRLVEAAGEIRDRAGTLLAEATATFVRVGAAERARLERVYGVLEGDGATETQRTQNTREATKERR
jgi:uncharacterized protein (TIGR00369 family)/excisionase family DNA binding protein